MIVRVIVFICFFLKNYSYAIDDIFQAGKSYPLKKIMTIIFGENNDANFLVLDSLNSSVSKGAQLLPIKDVGANFYTRVYWEKLAFKNNQLYTVMLYQEDKSFIDQLVREQRVSQAYAQEYHNMLLYFIHDGYKFYLFDPMPPKGVKRIEKFSKILTRGGSHDVWQIPSNKVVKKFRNKNLIKKRLRNYAIWLKKIKR